MSNYAIFILLGMQNFLLIGIIYGILIEKIRSEKQ